MDEFGAFLKRINNKGASGWEAATSKTMRELWGLSFQRYDAMEWANKSSEVVISPAFSVLGFSTPDEFFESLAGSDLKNGFLIGSCISQPSKIISSTRTRSCRPTFPRKSQKLSIRCFSGVMDHVRLQPPAAEL
jgi:hypothetical protein